MFGAAAFEVPALFCAGRWDEGVGNNAESALKRTRMITRLWRLESSRAGYCKAQLKQQGKIAGRVFGAAAFEALAFFLCRKKR